MSPLIAIRTDSSGALGSGHLMRCLCLADAWRARGAEVALICRDLPGNAAAEAARAGFAPLMLAGPHDPVRDAAQTREALASLGRVPDWLVVDHYGLGAEWEAAMSGAAKRLLVVDDLGGRPHRCDALLNQNPSEADRYAGLLPRECRLLLGPQFALLRPEFAAARPSPPSAGAISPRVFLFFGGTDPTRQTLKFARALAPALEREGLEVEAVIGRGHPDGGALRALAGPRLRVHEQTARMAELMASCGLALAAGGINTYERLCVGLPSVVVAVADNQVATAVALHASGCQEYLGRDSAVSAEEGAARLLALRARPEAARAMARRGMELVDGAGAARALDALGDA